MSLSILDDLERTSLIMYSEHEYTNEHKQFLQGCQVNVDLYRDMYWAILIVEVPAEDLYTELYNNQSKFKGKMFEAISTLLHKHLSDMSISKDDCDVTLLYNIIRNLQTSLLPPTQGWGIEPLPTNISITDDVERMRFSRNKLYGLLIMPSLNETDFNALMVEAEAIVERVGQHLHVSGSENQFKKDLGNIRNNDISDQWEIQIKELSEIEIENRESIEVHRERIEKNTEGIKEDRKIIEEDRKRIKVLESFYSSAAAGWANTYKGESSKRCIHEAKTLIKDDERQGYYMKGKIVKKYSLLKEKMKKEDTTMLASALVLHEQITDNQMEAVEERPRRRDAVEKLLKLVLRGDSEMHKRFVSECETMDNVKVVCDAYLSEKEMDAFIGLELMDKGMCRRPPDGTKLEFTYHQTCLLITALNDELNSEVSNDELLSRLCISVDEHTKVWNCEMGNEKRINKLIATMQECDSSVLQTLCEILDSSKMTHIADSLIGRTVPDDQSSDRSPLATLQQDISKCSPFQAQIDCHLNNITKRPMTFHLTAGSNKWKKLKENCSSGTIRSLIEQLYQMLASNGALGIVGALGKEEYRMDVTIYTITHLGTKEAEKAFLHLSTDEYPAATGSDYGYDQLDVRFNPMLDHYDILVEELDVTLRLLRSLYDNYCIAYGDIEDTLAIDSRSDQAEHLFNKLIGLGPKCYNILQEHLRVTNKDMFNLLQERDINLKRKKFYAGTFAFQVYHTSAPEGDKTTDKATVTCTDIINATCYFQSNEGTGQTLETDSHDNHAEEERLKEETTLDQVDKWKAALVKAYESLMNEMSTETAVYMTNLLLENKSISEDQSHIIKKCDFRRETVGNLLHCVLRGDQKTWDVFRSGLGIILEDITTTDQQEFLRLENLTFENGKRMHHQEPRLRLKECDVVTLTCSFLSNVTAIDKLNDGLLSKFHFSRQEHEAILNCDRDILYRADLFISTMEQCSENIVEDFLSVLEDVGLDDVVGQLKHHVAKERHEKGSLQQDDMDTGSTSLKRKLLALRQYLLRKFGFYLDHKTGLGRIELVPRDSEAWTNLEKSGEIENLVPLLYSNLLTHPLLQSSENRVLSLKIYIHDNHCRSRKFVSGRTATIDLIETTEEDTTASRHGLLIDDRHNPIEMHEDLLLEGIEIASLLGDFKDQGVLGHFPDIEEAGIRSRSKEMRHLLRRLSPTGRKVYTVLLLNVKKNDPAIFHEIEARKKLAAESREYFTAEVQATVLMQGDLKRRTLQVNNPTFHFKLQGLKTSINDEPLSSDSDDSEDGKKKEKKRKKTQEGKKEEMDEYALPKPFSRKGPVGRVLHDDIWKRWEQSIDDSNLDGIQSLLKTGDLPDNDLFGQLCDNEGLDSNIVKNVCDTIGRAMKTDSEQILCVWSGYRPDNEEQIVFVACTSVATRYPKPFVVYPLNTFSVIFRGANDFSSEAKDVLYSRESMDKMFTERERQNIRICIQENSKQLMHDHSNLTIISASPVRSEGFGTEISAKRPDTCIVLYLHVKGVVPLSEKPFPKLLKDSRGEVEFPVDVREGGFVNLSGHEASKPHLNLRIGCQIGSDWNQNCKGTLGAFVNLPDGTLGCITCAHVLLSDYQLNILRKQENVILTDLKSVGDVDYIRVFQPAVREDETPIGHVCKAIYRVGGVGVTGVDVAIVKLTDEQRHPITGCVPDGYHDHAGFTEENKMHFSSGEASSCEPNDTEYEAGLLKFGCCSGITRGKLHIHGPSVRRQTLSGTHMNFGFELHDQIECLPTKPVFAEPGDSGALVFIAKGGDHHKLKAVGIVEGCTSMDTVLLTPIWEVLDALGLQNNLKVFQHGSIFGRQSNAESTVEATAQCSPPRVCPSSSSHADTFQGDSDGLASVIANVSRTDSELRKEMSELRQDFKKFSENQDMKLQKIMDLLQANHQK